MGHSVLVKDSATNRGEVRWGASRWLGVVMLVWGFVRLTPRFLRLRCLSTDAG